MHTLEVRLVEVFVHVVENTLCNVFDFGANGLGELVFLDVVRVHNDLVIGVAGLAIKSSVHDIKRLTGVVTLEFEANPYFVQDVSTLTGETVLPIH